MNILVLTLLFVLTMLSCDLSQNPNQGSSPTPAPTVSDPSPSPEPSPSHPVCSLPSLPDHGDCPYTPNDIHFLSQVTQAIDEVKAKHPENFDFNDQPWGEPRIIDLPTYVFAVIDAIREQGLCATTDQKLEEIGVKNVNDFNEQFKVYRSGPYPWKGRGSYKSTCFPSAF